MLFLCVTCLHEAAFDVNGHWEEVDEEKSQDCPIELNDLLDADSKQSYRQTQTQQAQDKYELVAVDVSDL